MLLDLDVAPRADRVRAISLGIRPNERKTSPLPIRASSCEPGLREGQGPRRRRAERAQASSPSTRARAEQAGGGQQESIQTGAGSTAQETTFEYAADETRVVRRDPDRVRHFVTDLYQRLIDPTSSTTLEERFRVYAGGRQLGEIVRESGSDKTLFFHTDDLGSVDTITDQTGAVTRQTFEPFGAPVDAPSTSLTRAGFTGHQHDAELGLIDMNGRVYDTLAGRFVSADPIKQAPYWSQGINRYSYVFNDPINQTDPSGFISSSDFAGFAFAAPFVGAMLSVIPGGLGSVGAGFATQGALAATGGMPGAAQAGTGPMAVAPGQVQGAPYPQESPSADKIDPGEIPDWGPADWQDVLRKAKWTDSQRNAAFLWEDSVIQQSIRMNREFYTFIVERNGRYAALPTMVGDSGSSPKAPQYLQSFKDAKIRGVKVTAAPHTHGAPTSYENPRLTDDVFSTHRGGDADFARANGLTGYLGTPHGRLLELRPGQTVGTDLGVLPSYGIP